MSLKDLYLLVHINVILILCVCTLLIVYLVFCVEYVQHTYVLFFGAQRQNYAFTEIESWIHLVSPEELYLLV